MTTTISGPLVINGTCAKPNTDMSEYTEGAIHQLADQLERVGFTAGEVKAAGETGRLEDFLGILRGTHQIVRIEHVINILLLCKLPFNGAEREVQFVAVGETIWKLEKRGDDLYVDRGNGFEKLGLYRSEHQLNGKSILGHELRTEIEGRPEAKLPAALLDYLVEHPLLWPESWKKDVGGNTTYIYFWGDLFRDSDGPLYVRYGYWKGGGVVSGCRWLVYPWNGLNPAGSLSSSTKP